MTTLGHIAIVDSAQNVFTFFFMVTLNDGTGTAFGGAPRPLPRMLERR